MFCNLCKNLYLRDLSCFTAIPKTRIKRNWPAKLDCPGPRYELELQLLYVFLVSDELFKNCRNYFSNIISNSKIIIFSDGDVSSKEGS